MLLFISIYRDLLSKVFNKLVGIKCIKSNLSLKRNIFLFLG